MSIGVEAMTGLRPLLSSVLFFFAQEAWSQSTKCASLVDTLFEVLSDKVHKISVRSLIPFKKLAGNTSTKVFGMTPFSSKTLGEKILRKTALFDDKMKTAGFSHHTPRTTQIILRDYPIIPRFNYSWAYTPPGGKWNLWQGDIDATIYLEALSTSTLFHERAHTILRFHYPPLAYINRNRTVSEALADFLSAHATGYPKILLTNNSNRDISKLRISLDQTHNGYYDDSLHLSHILWEVRKAVGEEQMSHLIKPFLENLNSFREDFENKISLLSKSTKGRLIRDIYFFLISLRFTIYEELASEVQERALRTISDIEGKYPELRRQRMQI